MLLEPRVDLFVAHAVQSYEVIIVSPSFAGKTTLKKHREGALFLSFFFRPALSSVALG
jgi:hypothetical protein